MDKACAILNFFSGLKLSKSQADSLLSQLAADWQIEYDTIGELIALAAVLYIDASRLESRQAVVLHIDLQHAFDRAVQMWRRSRQGRAERRAGEKFVGIGVTDDYNAYHSQFAEHQLCWAHFLRKAIAVSLRNPSNRQYKRFLKSLFAKRIGSQHGQTIRVRFAS